MQTNMINGMGKASLDDGRKEKWVRVVEGPQFQKQAEFSPLQFILIGSGSTFRSR